MRRSLLATFLVACFAGGCLFSTTPPQRPPNEDQGADPNLVVVTGLVRHFDRTDSHYRNMPGRPVAVEWIANFRDRWGQLVVLDEDIVVSQGAGVYRAEHSDPRLGSVRLRAFLCIDREPDFECCLDLENPCQDCQVWMPPLTVSVVPGQQVQKDLIVPCEHVP